MTFACTIVGRAGWRRSAFDREAPQHPSSGRPGTWAQRCGWRPRLSWEDRLCSSADCCWREEGALGRPRQVPKRLVERGCWGGPATRRGCRPAGAPMGRLCACPFHRWCGPEWRPARGRSDGLGASYVCREGGRSAPLVVLNARRFSAMPQRRVCQTWPSFARPEMLGVFLSSCGAHAARSHLLDIDLAQSWRSQLA